MGGRAFLDANNGWQIHSGSPECCNGKFAARRSIRARYRISWYDSLVVAAAVDLNGLRIENPFRSN